MFELNSAIPDSEIPGLREDYLSGQAAILPAHLGYFLMWFSTTEMLITRTLSVILGQKDMGRFDLLVKGMDARVKCERLRKACKKYNPMGENYAKSSARFEKTSIGIRNKLAHSWAVNLGPDDPFIHLTSVHRVPPGTIEPRPDIGTAETIRMDDLFREALWLNSYSQDLLGSLEALGDGKPLEIADPRLHQPMRPH